jgi:hypothetical protein
VLTGGEMWWWLWVVFGYSLVSIHIDQSPPTHDLT